ncbi:glutamyl aminopeptidase isoform X2 [Nematostella vectensis]|uniref:glutamyl aminopeptidase isoform X2 n=1 Tax=Nematostella vectensis TaxID=45351 RepID=UPI0020774CE4|nr:glutamyl aminopeptidase isoform X2 [Nematostella vectensis]
MANLSGHREEHEQIRLGTVDSKVHSKRRKRSYVGGVYITRVKLNVLTVALFLFAILFLLFVILYGLSVRNKDSMSTPKGVVSTSTVHSTAGPGPWTSLRLSDEVIPYHYNVDLSVSLADKCTHGRVEIFVRIARATKHLMLHCKHLNISAVSVTKYDGSGKAEIARHFWYKETQLYVIVLKSWFLSGSGDIKIWYRGLVTNDLVGLYQDEYKQQSGGKSIYVASQLFPTEARKVLPCFDEPKFKATFTITLVHDRPEYLTLSNMPAKSTFLQGDSRRTVFEQTPKMSTYLLALAIVDFRNKTQITDGKVEVSFYAAPHMTGQLSYAQMVADKVLPFYAQYFGIDYPLPKADMIALPDFVFRAMENWGLVMYREENLLWREDTSSEVHKQYVGELVSHELAHQWFGNLVTMTWWDDLWLNEGFASYVWYLGLDAVEPEWNLMNQFIVETLSNAQILDGMTSSHPIIRPISDPAKMGDLLDSITYDKGACILRMLDDFLGTDTFVTGVKKYLKEHVYGSAQTDDLWNALTEESCRRDSCVDVKNVMDTWTLQMGFPVVSIKRQNGTHFSVTQSRFLFDTRVSSKLQLTSNNSWIIPFTFIKQDNPQTKHSLILKQQEFIAWDGGGWLKGNYQHRGYYLVNYDNSNWDAIITQLKTNHTVFSSADRAGAIKDAFYLARVGLLPYAKALSLTEYMVNETAYVPWKALSDSVHYIEIKLPITGNAYSNLQKYLAYISRNIYRKLSFIDKGSHLDKLTRGMILSMNCKAKVESCTRKAKKMFRDWMDDTVEKRVSPNFRSLVYFYGIQHGGPDEWDFAFNYSRNKVP